MNEHPVVIVTGASQGIGAGLVNRFLDHGYKVVATSRTVSASKDLPASDRLVRVDGDIASADTARRVVESAVADFGAVDALVNNAGIFTSKAFVDTTLDEFRALQATNIDGFLFMTQAVIRQMLAQGSGGSIVSITSPLADAPILGTKATASMITKGGIEAATRNLAMEYAANGIRVNTVAPGIVDTPMNAGGPTEALSRLSPIRGISSIDDVVDAVLFLMEASRITGESIRVDGGGHLGKW